MTGLTMIVICKYFFQDMGIRIPYLRVLGVTEDSEAADVLLGRFSPEDEEEMEQMAQTPNMYVLLITQTILIIQITLINLAHRTPLLVLNRSRYKARS